MLAACPHTAQLHREQLRHAPASLDGTRNTLICRPADAEPPKPKKKKKMKIKPGKGTGTKTVFDADGRQLDPLEALQSALQVLILRHCCVCHLSHARTQELAAGLLASRLLVALHGY